MDLASTAEPVGTTLRQCKLWPSLISLVPLVQLQHVAHERATTISIIKATECNLSAVTSRLSIWVITQLLKLEVTLDKLHSVALMINMVLA